MKQKELADRYEVTPQRIGQIRKKICDNDDYCKKTRTLTPEGVAKIEEYFKIQDNKIIEPNFVRVQVLSPCPNPLFFFCKLLDGVKRKVIVAIPSTHRGSFRTGHVFKAQVIEKAGEPFYRHELLYKREQQRI